MDGLEELINIISTKLGVDVASSSRKGDIPVARRIYCVLAYRITPFVWAEITGKVGISTPMMSHYQNTHQDMYGFDKKYTAMYDEILAATRYIRDYYLDDDIKTEDKNPLEIQIELLEKNTKKFQNGKLNSKTYLRAARKIISGLKQIEYEACK